VWNAPEIVRKVGINDVRMAAKQHLFHFNDRLLGVAPRTVRILLGWKIGLIDRFQHQHRCCHADPIPQGRDTQWPELAIGLWNKHSSDRVRSISPLSERKRQFTQPPLDPIRFDVRKVLFVHPRCTLVRATLGIGMRQDIFSVNLVVQGIKAEARLCLRFRV
jgi:hypothetical protein